MASKSAKAKAKHHKGFGVFSPWILLPSHNKRVGQNTSMMSGVPEPARYKNGVDSTVNIEARSATLDLNQRFKRRIKRSPSPNPMIIEGSLMA